MLNFSVQRKLMFANAPTPSVKTVRMNPLWIVKRNRSIVLAFSLAWSICGAEPQVSTALGLPVIDVPSNNPQTVTKIALGEKLFFDKRLSGGGQISCASCHQPNRAFADDRPLARGTSGRLGTRNAPSLRNAALTDAQFWDGRRATLEAQAGDPFINPSEHGLRSHEQLLTLLRGDSDYRTRFKDVFGTAASEIALTQVTHALASYLRALPMGNSAFDRFKYGDQEQAMPRAARRGYELFVGRARCVSCHIVGERSASFTDNRYHSLGIGLGPISAKLARLTTQVAGMPKEQLDRLVLRSREVAALGRFVVTHEPGDIGRFKTPSLRNVALTAPYMHDGSVPTLEDAVDQEAYYRGLEAGRPLILTPAEKADLVAFLRALTSLP